MTFELIGREVLNFFELQVKVSTLHFLGRKVKFRILKKLSDLLNWIFLELTFLEIYNQQSNEILGVGDLHFHMLE